MSGSLGLYLHIPFCVQKCAYCAFYSLPGQGAGRQRDYVRALEEQLRRWAPRCRGRRVDTVYLGGGTPSYLGGPALAGLLSWVRRLFAVEEGAEITVECNPESVTPELLTALRRAGANRLSLGVQSLSDERLRTLGRAHDAAGARAAYRLARRAGFDNISVDLMYGLPGQGLEDWRREVEGILSWRPEHLSAYVLTVEAGTPMARLPEDLFPDEDAQADQYELLCRLAAGAGYRHYEISNFALPGRHSRHNSRYWDLSDYLGLGPGAHSYLDGRRFFFEADLAAFLTSSCPPRQEEQGPFHRGDEYVMLMLRTQRGVEEGEFARRFGRPFTPYAQRLRPFLPLGLAAEEGGRWRLTERGFLVSNAILTEVLDGE